MNTPQDTTDTTTTDAKDTTMSTTDTAEAGTVTADPNNVVPFARKATEEPTDTATDNGSTAEEPTEGTMMVDQRGYGGPSWLDSLRAQKRRDILPGYLTSWREARATAGWLARHYAHTTGYHAVRCSWSRLPVGGCSTWKAAMSAWRRSARLTPRPT